jgi:ATP-binding cassette, subfamily B, bacterial CvaB/MchF/RaxB
VDSGTGVRIAGRSRSHVRELSERLGLRRRQVPLVLQSEAAECGIACLAMVAGYHGHRIDLASLRRRMPPSIRGVTLRGLMANAAALRLTGRALRLDLDQLGELRTPCILHWDLTHFVVLVRAKGGRALIHDPAHGRRMYRQAELSTHFTGVALELTPTAEFEPLRQERTLRIQDLWSRVHGLGRALGFVFALSALLQLALLAAPFYTQIVVDHVIAQGDRDLLAVLAVGFGLVLVFRVIAGLVRDHAVLATSQLLSLQMSTNLVSHLVRLPLSYFERRHMADVLSRVRSLDPIQELLTSGFVEATVDAIMTLAVVALMFIYSPQLTAIAIVAALLFALLRTLLYRPVRQLREEGIIAGAREESATLETLRGMQAVKLLGIEAFRDALWQNRRADTMNAEVRAARWELGFGASSALLFGLENLIVIYFAATLVFAGQMTIGMLYAFLSYKTQFSDRVNAVISWILKFRMLDVHLARLADVVHTREEEGLRSPATGASQEGSVRIELRDVSFRYGEAEPWTLRNLSLVIEAGSCVCLIGRSGGGKTTLLKLILGLLEPTEGEVLVNGRRLAGSGLSAYRRRVGSVMQDDHFFEGTLAENVSAFDPDEDLQRVQAAAEQACIHEEIAAMPMGYQSWMGNMGATFSGGQRQRILLARALYRDPQLLVLDEGTANLDPALVQAICERIGQLTVTRVLATHQQGVLPIAQRVLLIDAGTITELEIGPARGPEIPRRRPDLVGVPSATSAGTA